VDAATNCNWDNLPYLVLGGHVIFMLVISIPASFLIPNEAQDADLLKVEEIQEEVGIEEDWNMDDLVL
jgi:hypothetical protein